MFNIVRRLTGHALMFAACEAFGLSMHARRLIQIAIENEGW